MSKPDRSLLDRLNALKPSSVSLGKKERIEDAAAQAPTTADIDGPSGLSLTPAAPPTREDRLAARLKTLRETRDGSDGGDDGDENKNNTSGGKENEKPVASSPQPSLPSRESDTPASESKTPDKAEPNTGEDGEDAADDPLFHVDDDAVNDLLLELAADGGGLEDEDLGDYEDEADRFARDADGADDDGLIPLPSVPKDLGDDFSGDEGEDADNSKMVEDLLKSLAGTTIKDDGVAGTKDKKDTSKDDSDDSDGETMEREVRRVLERAQDEADLAKQQGDGEASDEDEDIVTSPRRRGTDLEDDILPGEKPPAKSKTEDADNFLGLPTVPTKLVDPPPSPPSLPSLSNDLPSVPTQTLPKRGDDDDISARLAALRGLQGKAAGLGQTDAFGLPSAPTFRPGEEEGGVLKRGHYGHGRRNYTDADQKAWCVVCLEDATVRCLGCADNNGSEDDEDQNNAYCNRCWRDMHVGPAAGFDERGHKRVPLVR